MTGLIGETMNIRALVIQAPFKVFSLIDELFHIPSKIAHLEYTVIICRLKGTHDPTQERMHAAFYSNQEGASPQDYVECLECMDMITLPCECTEEELKESNG